MIITKTIYQYMSNAVYIIEHLRSGRSLKFNKGIIIKHVVPTIIIRHSILYQQFTFEGSRTYMEAEWPNPKLNVGNCLKSSEL